MLTDLYVKHPLETVVIVLAVAMICMLALHLLNEHGKCRNRK